MSPRNSTSSTPSDFLSANTTALTTPDVEHGPILFDKAAVEARQQVVSALHHAEVDEALRGAVAATELTASTELQSATKTTLGQPSMGISSTGAASSSSGAKNSARPVTPPQGIKPKLTKFSSPVHPPEPLCRVFDPSVDDKKTIEELIARRPGPGARIRDYPTRPWDEEKEKKERQEDRAVELAKLRKAAEELGELPFFKK